MAVNIDNLLAEERKNMSLDLSQPQLQWLMEKMSTEDQTLLKNHFRSCSGEMFMTRGVPFSVFTVGSLWAARQFMPKTKAFGPNGWPFYAIIGVASLTCASVLTFPTCFDRSKPLLQDLYKKYDQESPESRTKYDALRQANRQGKYQSDYSQPLSNYIGSQPENEQKIPPKRPFIQEEENSFFMSGTPVGPPINNSYLPINDQTQNSYGDKGFSS